MEYESPMSDSSVESHLETHPVKKKSSARVSESDASQVDAVRPTGTNSRGNAVRPTGTNSRENIDRPTTNFRRNTTAKNTV